MTVLIPEIRRKLNLKYGSDIMAGYLDGNYVTDHQLAAYLRKIGGSNWTYKKLCEDEICVLSTTGKVVAKIVYRNEKFDFIATTVR